MKKNGRLVIPEVIYLRVAGRREIKRLIQKTAKATGINTAAGAVAHMLAELARKVSK